MNINYALVIVTPPVQRCFIDVWDDVGGADVAHGDPAACITITERMRERSLIAIQDP